VTQATPPTLARAFPVLAVAVAVLGGLFGGLFACGRFSWQPTLIYAIVAAPTIIAVAWSQRAMGFLKRVGFVVAVVVVFVVAERVGGAFYPGPPSELRDFVARFVGGPC
jgi:MFS-type transporter involved in bile tolerance (Atg22 family)